MKINKIEFLHQFYLKDSFLKYKGFLIPYSLFYMKNSHPFV